MLNKFIGGSAQLDVRLNVALTFYNEFSYRSRTGSYGKTGTSNILYSKHNGDVLSYKGTFSYKKANALHLLSGNVTKETLENNENIYKYVNQPNGQTEIVYYGETKMLNQDIIKVSADYKGYLGLNQNSPVWVLNAGGDYTNRKQTTSIYPFFRKQTINMMGIYLNADRNFKKGNDMYTIALGLNYGSGSGTPMKDGLYATPSDGQAPSSLNTVLMREYEYLTATRTGGIIGFTYSHLFNNMMRGYANLNYHLTSAQNISYVKGNTYQFIEIKIGCSF